MSDRVRRVAVVVAGLRASIHKALVAKDYDLTLSRLRIAAFFVGAALLFWQRDLSGTDVLFGVALASSVALVVARRPVFEAAWPQLLLLTFVIWTGAATLFAGGSMSALAITTYLAVVTLALPTVLAGRVERMWFLELMIVCAGVVAAILTALGYVAHQMGWAAFQTLAYDAYRGQGLFKDPNAAGGFVACTYPFAAALAVGTRRFRAGALVILTVAIGAGVIFSFSREALALFVLGLLGVAGFLAISGERKLLLALVALGMLSAASAGGLSRLPNYRGYQLLNPYDQNGRFVVWRFAIDMLRSAPLGTGAGSFEARSQAMFDEILGRNSAPVPIDSTGVAPVAVDTTAGFHSANVARPARITLSAGTLSEPISVAYRNTGTKAWLRGVAGQEASLGIGENGLVLEGSAHSVIARLTDMSDESDSSMNAGWPAADRVAVQVEGNVRPGAEATFTFRVRAPRDGGTYQLHLRPVVDGATWMEDDGVVLEIVVTGSITSPPVYRPASPSGPTTVDGYRPTPPSTYAVPTSAIRVSSATELVRALANPVAQDIVLADGIYDNDGPFYDAYGHRVYAANLGRAVLRAGFSVGGNSARGGARLQGVTFDVTSPEKTLTNAIVNVWGSGSGASVEDVTMSGNHKIDTGILLSALEAAVIQRVSISEVSEFGVAVLHGSATVPPHLQDVAVSNVVRVDAADARNPSGQSCLSLASAVLIEGARLRSCGFAAVWAGEATTARLDGIDIDGAAIGLTVDETASQISVHHLRLGPLVSAGLRVPGLSVRQASAPSGDLVVVPSAHNTYLRVAVESGAFGFLALCAYLILVYWALLREPWRENWALQLALSLALLSGFAIDTLHWRLLWVYLAMAIATSERAPAPFARAAIAARLRALHLWRTARSPS